MDRRSWLWRRKSSEKSPGETESFGSVSSHSERFSDDQVTFFCLNRKIKIPTFIANASVSNLIPCINGDNREGS